MYLLAPGRIGGSVLLILWLITTSRVQAQELEPRLLTNLPKGTNFLITGYGFSSGNVLMDPSLSIEDLNAKLHTLFAAYARSINLFGNSGKVDVVLPFAGGDWSGVVDGIDSTTSRTGFGDLRVRFSYNFVGSPALSIADYPQYQQKTIVGASLQIFAPTGNYLEEKIINLGANRWTFKPQIGASRVLNRWILEFYLSAWFFGSNNEFLVDKSLVQRPLGTIKAHLIHSFPKNIWAALDIGYGAGGRAEIDQEPRNVRISSMRLGLTFAVPFAQRHAIKIVALSGIRFEEGPDFDGLVVAYQYRWFRKNE